jgi:hypothetical protein
VGGADRELIDSISGELLPQRYNRIAEYPIMHAGKQDFMDVNMLR